MVKKKSELTKRAQTVRRLAKKFADGLEHKEKVEKARKIARKPSARSLTKPGEFKRRRVEVTEPPSKRWYVAISNANREGTAAEGLKEKDLAVYFPMAQSIALKVRGGKRRLRMVDERPLMPGYMFVSNPRAPAPGQANDFPFDQVRGVDGVERLLKVDGQYVAVRHSVIEKLVERENSGAFDLSKGHKRKVLEDVGLKEGDVMQVSDGPFASFCGIVQKLIGGDRVELLVSIFGRGTPVELELDQVEKVS